MIDGVHEGSAEMPGSVPWCDKYDADTLSTGVEVLAEAMGRIGRLDEDLFFSAMTYAFFLGKGQDPTQVTELPDDLELFLIEAAKARKECAFSYMLVSQFLTTRAGSDGETLLCPGKRGIEFVATELQADGQRPRGIGQE